MISEVEKQIGQRIHKYMRVKNKKFKEVADMLNISYQQLYKYVHGIDKIKASRLIQLANCLQVPVDMFLFNEDEMNNKLHKNIVSDEETFLLMNFRSIKSAENKTMILKFVNIVKHSKY